MKKYLIGYTIVTIFWILGVLSWEINWSDERAPAWVQAVGSVLAIVAAVCIAAWETRRARVAAIQAQFEAKQREHRQATETRRQIKYTRMAERSKATHVAALAFGLVIDALNDLAEIAAEVPIETFSTGMVERFRDQRTFVAGLDLSPLSAAETAAIVKLRDACSAAIALLLIPEGLKGAMARTLIFSSAAEIKIDVERAKAKFELG